MNPRDIAKLITEDPDVPAAQISETGMGRKRGWDFEKPYAAEELENPELLGNLVFGVDCVIGADYEEGEPMVRYYSDGSGYPGSPPSFEWDIITITGFNAYNEDGDEVTLETTPELIERLKEAVRQSLDDDKVMEFMSSEMEDPDDYDYELYDRYRNGY